MARYDWTKFTITADFNADVRSIYKAWTTPAGLESWFLRKADFYTITGRLRGKDESILKEDTYEWLWHGFGDDTLQKGEVLEVNEIDFLKFTFTDDTIVSVSLRSANGLTILELTQENIKEEPDPGQNLFIQCQTGWTFYLANLKSIIEGGIDLRNKRMDVRSNFK
ncbi:MAG: SRPBCC domain-containing protein [Bacteroidetes bacterium]|nr:SRPBCC domain-containing protein [Bacteroidota bacterium]